VQYSQLPLSSQATHISLHGIYQFFKERQNIPKSCPSVQHRLSSASLPVKRVLDRCAEWSKDKNTFGPFFFDGTRSDDETDLVRRRYPLKTNDNPCIDTESL